MFKEKKLKKFILCLLRSLMESRLEFNRRLKFIKYIK